MHECAPPQLSRPLIGGGGGGGNAYSYSLVLPRQNLLYTVYTKLLPNLNVTE